VILSFPSADALRLTLAGGLVPAEIAAGPGSASFATDGRVAVDFDGTLTKPQRAALAERGVKELRRHLGEAESFVAWPQLIPAVPLAKPPALTAQTPVLFDVPDSATMGELVTEMLRLGNDRMSFRNAAGLNGTTRILLRVVGPPYYTLLRATEEYAGESRAVTAFVEAAPRVWVALGFTHPLVTQVAVPEGHVLFVSPPRGWAVVPDAPFRDVYEILEFPLPHAPVAYADAGPGEAITVPLRLAAGPANETPELWVLPESDHDAFDSFVRDGDERLLRRLRFAVATDAAGGRRVVVGLIPSKSPPPALAWPGALALKPYWKLPNLFVPVGKRIHPPLRRETVRRLLAANPDELVWLEGAERFVPFALPDAAFRPLDEWVEYVIERAAEPLTEWVGSTTFDFDAFVCVDQSPRLATGPGSGGGKAKAEEEKPVRPRGPKKPPDKLATLPFAPPEAVAPVDSPVKTPNEWEVRRTELEGQFLGDGDGPLDSPARIALWPELAACYAALGQKEDAALAFAHAAANGRDIALPWLACETGLRELTPERFDAVLVNEPANADVRALAAATVAGLPEPWFASRLAAVQAYVARHDARLPVRIAWLVATRLSAVAGADELGLARTRDRLLARLYEGGLNPERDLPTFLRYAGLKDSERARVVREKALRLHAAVQAWAAKGLASAPAHTNGDTVHTPALIDLAFAYAFARIQDSETAKRLLGKAATALAPSPGGSEFRNRALPVAVAAYRYRVESALAGRPVSGPLPSEVRAAYRALAAATDAPSDTPPIAAPVGAIQNPTRFARYNLDRLFDLSRIIDPTDPKDAIDVYTSHGNDWKRAVHALGVIERTEELTRAVRNLLAKGTNGTPLTAGQRLEIVYKSIPLAGRVGESFAAELLPLVPAAVTAVEDVPAKKAERQGALLERALTLAAHFGRREDVAGVITLFVETMRAKPEVERYPLVNALGATAVAHLRVLGMRDEVDGLLAKLRDELLAGDSPDTLRVRFAARPKEWAECLRSLLVIAGGWLAFGNEAAAAPILDAAANELARPHPKLATLDYAGLARAYFNANAAAPPEIGLGRIEAFFESTEPGRVQNGMSTAPHFSKSHVELAEAVVMALTADEALGGLGGRRWRDEDEYLIRKRIHEDVRRV
jgi:hypothetical protein